MLPRKSQPGCGTRKLLSAAVFVAIVGAALLGLPARATQFSIDSSDLWWNPNESGWGLQLVQRSEVIFATLFVYNSAEAPTWYTATLEPNGLPSWTGQLMQCSGSWFGSAPFNAGVSSCRQVGTMTFSAIGDVDGMLLYSVDGVTVNKMITRQTLRMQNPTGNYVGILSADAVGCLNAADAGKRHNRIDFQLTQSGGALTMTSQEQGSAAVCTSSGSYTQTGQFAEGTQIISSCSDGSKSPGDVMILDQIVVSVTGVTMNFTAPTSNSGQKGCTVSGSIYGIRQQS